MSLLHNLTPQLSNDMKPACTNKNGNTKWARKRKWLSEIHVFVEIKWQIKKTNEVEDGENATTQISHTFLF